MYLESHAYLQVESVVCVPVAGEMGFCDLLDNWPLKEPIDGCPQREPS